MDVRCRGVRGATTVEANTRDAILAGATELLNRMIDDNGMREEDVASVIFSVTPDLDATYPAAAARELGWHSTALFCCREIPVARSPAMCIRVLVHCNTARTQGEVRHVYLHGARSLRPDLAEEGGK